jgi:hypothetical protein
MQVVFYWPNHLLIGNSYIGAFYKTADVFKPDIGVQFHFPVLHVAIGTGEIISF